MKKQFSLLSLAAVAVLAVSCAKDDSNKAPDYSPDSERAISQPRFSFQEEKQSLKYESLSSSEIFELMACNEKSSSERAERKKF